MGAAAIGTSVAPGKRSSVDVGRRRTPDGCDSPATRSTERPPASPRTAASTGDAAWRRLLDRHDAVNRNAVTRRGGEVIKTTGDGVLALLPSATAAIEAARHIRNELRAENLQTRIGTHVGEIDRRGEDVSGLAVNIASRIMASAQPDQILASAFVAHSTDVARFASLGPRTLKDVDGTWELFTVE